MIFISIKFSTHFFRFFATNSKFSLLLAEPDLQAAGNPDSTDGDSEIFQVLFLSVFFGFIITQQH